MNNALIGFTGFVGSMLLKQTQFDSLYRSASIQEANNHEFDLVVCAGAPAQKWVANNNPDHDRANIDSLIGHLQTIKCGVFILISTVDVFQSPDGVDETDVINEAGLHPYGLHRRLLEKFVQQHFTKHLIIRLPGLVGPGLRKNVVFDFLNNNNLHTVDSRSVFQFYPMVNLWYDIQIALKEGLQLAHLTAEPISVAEVTIQGFGRSFTQLLANAPARYDMRTRYADLFGSKGQHQYSVRETIQAIRAYAQSEPITLMSESEATS